MSKITSEKSPVLSEDERSSKPNLKKDEYMFLRNEIMSRAGWHLEYTKNAATLTISIWAATFLLMRYLGEKDIKDFFDMPIFILLSPIVIFYPLSLKIYENYSKVCNIVSYLKKFHEVPLTENNGTFFSWETVHGDLLAHLYKNKSIIIKRLSKSNDELTFLSGISLCLFIFFSFWGFIKSYINIGMFILHIVVAVGGIWGIIKMALV